MKKTKTKKIRDFSVFFLVLLLLTFTANELLGKLKLLDVFAGEATNSDYCKENSDAAGCAYPFRVGEELDPKCSSDLNIDPNCYVDLSLLKTCESTTSESCPCNLYWKGSQIYALDTKKVFYCSDQQGSYKWTPTGVWQQNGNKIYYDSGNVGIGTDNPSASLEVKGSVAFGDGAKATGGAAFSSGYKTNASGDYSTALGVSSEASGNSSVASDSSVASGYRTLASGSSSASFGNSSQALGTNSVAMGTGTVSESYSSFVVGLYNKTSDDFDKTGWEGTDPLFVIGNGSGKEEEKRSNALTVLKNGNVGIGTDNPSTNLEVEGKATFDSNSSADIALDVKGPSTFGLNSQANLYGTAMGLNNQATGWYSFASGSNTWAHGSNSASFGSSTRALGDRSLSSGQKTEASVNAASFGYKTKAAGTNSVAMGEGTIAASHSSLAVGRYNKEKGTSYLWLKSDPVFVIGNGTDDKNRSNALTVLGSGKVGIGTDEPKQALQVSGTVQANEFCLDGFCLSKRIKQDGNTEKSIAFLNTGLASTSNIYADIFCDGDSDKCGSISAISRKINALKAKSAEIKQKLHTKYIKIDKDVKNALDNAICTLIRPSKDSDDYRNVEKWKLRCKMKNIPSCEGLPSGADWVKGKDRYIDEAESDPVYIKNATKQNACVYVCKEKDGYEYVDENENDDQPGKCELVSKECPQALLPNT